MEEKAFRPVIPAEGGIKEFLGRAVLTFIMALTGQQGVNDISAVLIVPEADFSSTGRAPKSLFNHRP
jgi:hypothetical protein